MWQEKSYLMEGNAEAIVTTCEKANVLESSYFKFAWLHHKNSTVLLSFRLCFCALLNIVIVDVKAELELSM